jgi:hypothetical protein
MNDLLVIAAASSDSGGTLPQYRAQLAAAGIPFHVVPLTGPPDATIAATLFYFRRLAEQFSSYKRLILTDAFDVSFFGTAADVPDTCAKVPLDHVLWAAEKNCFTDPHMATPIHARHPERSPWLYANGGMLAATPQVLYDWTLAVERHPLYADFFINQGFYNILLAAGWDQMCVDWRTDLFFCLHSGYSELDFERGKPVNTKWGTRPLFAHANGAWPTDDMWAKYHRSLQ